MTGLTIFTSPKPFNDPHVATIQRNAFLSWKNISPYVEVVIIGDEYGLPDIAAELNLFHIKDVICNELGTPLVSSIFNLARENSNFNYLAYVNADILLFPDFHSQVTNVSEQLGNFLLVGRRWDVDIVNLINYSSNWQKMVKELINKHGTLHRPAGSDYFVFPKDIFYQIPDFAIGRAGWDNWMIYNAIQNSWPVVDCTPTITVIHQNHDYSHLPGGNIHYKQEETFRNADLGGGMANMYLTLDATHQLIANKVRHPRPSLPRSLRKLERFFRPQLKEYGVRWKIARFFRRWRRRLV